MSDVPSSSGTTPSADQAAAPQHPEVPLTQFPPPPPPLGSSPASARQFTFSAETSTVQQPPVVPHSSLAEQYPVVSQLHAYSSLPPPVYSRPRPTATTQGQFQYGMPYVPDFTAAPATPPPRAPTSLPPPPPPPQTPRPHAALGTPQTELGTLVAGLLEATHAQIAMQRHQGDMLLAAQQQRGRPDPGVKQFKEMNPPYFVGEETPLQSEEWLRSTQDCLESARIPHHDWVSLARLQLKENARNWWDAELTRLAPPISWQQFTTAFYAKYFPEAARIQLQEEFLALELGNMTVDQYDAKYSKFGR